MSILTTSWTQHLVLLFSMSLSLPWPLWGLLVSLQLHLGTRDNYLGCCHSNNTCVGAAERWREAKVWREAQQSDRPSHWYNWTKTKSVHSFFLLPVMWALPNFLLHTQVNSCTHTMTTITHWKRERSGIPLLAGPSNYNTCTSRHRHYACLWVMLISCCTN